MDEGNQWGAAAIKKAIRGPKSITLLDAKFEKILKFINTNFNFFQSKSLSLEIFWPCSSVLLLNPGHLAST